MIILKWTSMEVKLKASNRTGLRWLTRDTSDILITVNSFCIT